LSPRQLVVTADDVGIARGMTRGALQAHIQGIVTAVAVAAAGRDFEPAVAALRSHLEQGHAVDVGLHWTLVEERPLSPPSQVRSLLTRGGTPLSGFRAFAGRYAARGLRYGEIEAEMRRQAERLLATGLAVVHANGHQHLHALPPLFEIALRLCEEYRIPYLRVPYEPAVAGRGSMRAVQLRVLNGFGRRARRRAPAGGPAFPDRTIGVADAGHLTAETIRRVLEKVEGVTELVCHPGQGDAELGALYRWGYGWERETAALCDPSLPGWLAAAGIELTSFSRLAAGASAGAAAGPRG
jgi:predicted glycoside hydrolase/deacetylase ChbG (UPF0249 family)